MCGSAERSLSHIEPVCGTPKRKSENGEQRLAPEKRHSGTERLEIADQRLGRADLPAGMSAVLTHPGITPQRPHWMAGVGGFEPPHGGIEVRCFGQERTGFPLRKERHCCGS